MDIEGVFNLNYMDIHSLNVADIKGSYTEISIYLDKNKPETLLTKLHYDQDIDGSYTFVHMQDYLSPMEFSTIAMKQVLTMFVKRKVVALDPDYYTPDDPKLHGFISKLSYEGIKYVAEHVEEFADLFKHNKVNELNIPKPSRKYRS